MKRNINNLGSYKAPEFEHIKPDEMEVESEDKHHRLELKVDGKIVGHAELIYFAKPIPSYYVSFVRTDFDSRGKGYGSAIVEQINRELDRKGKMGILCDVIHKDNPAAGLYGRHGWNESVKIRGWMTYNEPENARINDIEKTIENVVLLPSIDPSIGIKRKAA